jgi:photosystem II stability/assembly factor-like uncharacterized protein
MKKILIVLCSMTVLLSLAATPVLSQWLETTPSEEMKEDHAEDAMKWFYGIRAFGLGYIPQDGWIKAIKQRDALRDKYFGTGKGSTIQSVNASLANANWINVGPINIQSGYLSHSGRINTIVTDPTNDKIAYFGAANGGVWKTTNKGQSWHATSDNAYSLAMGALAIDPTNPSILYAGTGEFSKGVGAFFGAGMLKTTDAGKTWNSAGLGNVGAFSRVIVNPNKPTTVYAAGAGSGGGLYISTDGGSSWTKAAGGLPPGDVTDITYAQFHGNDMIYAGLPSHGVYLSQDGGVSWYNVNPFGASAQMRRIHVAEDPNNWQDVVALSVRFDGSLEGLVQSVDGGNTWNDISSGIGDLFGSNNQGWYDAYVQRDPIDAQKFLVGGISVWRTEDAGSSWADVGLAYQGGIHPDQHAAAFSKNGSDITYVGSDGGIAVSDDRGATYTVNQDSAAITESYGIAIDQVASDLTYTGNQDNGTLAGGRNGEWNVIGGGDGGTVVVDSKDHTKVYYIQPTAWAVYVNDGTNLSSGINTGDSVFWTKPLVQDETNHILYTGSQYLYVLANGTSSWARRSRNLAYPGYISTIAPAGDGKTLLVGTTDGSVWSSTNNGTSFTDRTSGLPGRSVTNIKASPTDVNTYYVTLSGFGASHVLKTTNLGANWKDITGTLPDISCNVIVVDKLHPTNLYVGTDVGVFFSPDDGADWLPYGTGLPNTAVTDMGYHYNNRVLRAGTHGRSMWEAPMATTVSGITTPTVTNIWYTGEAAQIGWYGVTSPVKVEISTDNATTWQTVSASATGNLLSIPTVSYSATENALVRVTSGTDVLQSEAFRIRVRPSGTTLSTFSEQNLYMYDLAYDKDDNVLFATSFSTPPTSPDPKIYKIDPNTGALLGSITTNQTGYFTGIKYDNLTKHLFVHQAIQSTPVVSNILEMTPTGTVVHKWSSPCAYGTGIFTSGDTLFLADRNNNVIHVVSKTNPLSTYPDLALDRKSSFGPRCITLNPATGNLLHTWTDFQGPEATAQLYDSYILNLDRYDGSELSSWFVQDGTNTGTNVRGIELDPRNGGTSIWVTVLNSGNSSKILKIQLSAPPPQPLTTSLISPANGSNKLDTSLVCTWAAASGATQYEFQLATDATFATTILDNSGITKTTATVNGLSSKTTYYWRVRASNTTTTGNWSDIWNFTVKNTNSVFDAGSTDDFFVTNYPNPYTDKTTIKYSIPERSLVSLTVMDLLGREIGTLITNTMDAGTHTVTFDGKSIAEGAYIVRLEAEGHVTTHLMHLVK